MTTEAFRTLSQTISIYTEPQTNRLLSVYFTLTKDRDGLGNTRALFILKLLEYREVHNLSSSLF